MPLVDYRLAGLDPWKKYEENRDYLLRRDALDEQIRSRESTERQNAQRIDLSAENLGLEREKFAEQKQFRRDQQAALTEKQSQDQAAKQQELYITQSSFLANNLAKATPENYSAIRDNILNTIFKSIDLGPGTPEEKLAAKNRLAEESPKEYNKKYVEDTLKTIYGTAEKAADALPVYMQSSQGGTAISFVPKNKAGIWKPPAGWSIVSKDKFDALNAGGKKAEYDEGGGKYTKAQVIDDTRAYYKELGKSLMDPEMPDFIRQGPESDPDKYKREYESLMNRMDSDLVAIEKGERPSWLKEKAAAHQESTITAPTSIADDISKYLKK